MTAIATPIRKLPPQSLDVERCVLGGMLLDPNAALVAAETLEAKDFYLPSHQLVFKTIFGLLKRKIPADLLTVSDVLRRENKLDSVGGVQYLATLVDSVPSAKHTKSYSNVIKEKSSLREAISKGTELIQFAYEGALNPKQLQKEIKRIGDDLRVLAKTFKKFERLSKKRATRTTKKRR